MTDLFLQFLDLFLLLLQGRRRLVRLLLQLFPCLLRELQLLLHVGLPFMELTKLFLRLFRLCTYPVQSILTIEASIH